MTNIRRTISIKFPFKDDENGKYFEMNSTTQNDIRSSLYFFLTSKKGERWYDPDFGTKLQEFLFEKNDNILEIDIKNSLKNDIEKYFKNVQLSDISFVKSDDETQLDIYIFFTYGDQYGYIEDNILLTFQI
jgi:phage baseplate assembly protein W